MEFFHGTSVGTGLESGDFFDPSKSAFEPCSWATSSLDVAKYWAGSSDAMYDAGKAVYRVEISDNAKVKTISDDTGMLDTLEEIELAIEEGFDAIIFEKGEDCVPTLAILSKFVARARGL